MFHFARKKSRPLCVRFSRRLAAQCSGPGGRALERRICDAIANGSMHPAGQRGRSGGPLVRFERTGPAAGPLRGNLGVLAEGLPEGWFALHLLRRSAARNKIGGGSDF